MTRQLGAGALPVRTQRRLQKVSAAQGGSLGQRSHVAPCTPTHILPEQRLAHSAGSLRFADMTEALPDPSSPLAIKCSPRSESDRPLTAAISDIILDRHKVGCRVISA